MSKQYIGAALVIFGAAFGFLGLWKWALFGLDSNVGIAWFFTTFVMISAGTFPWFWEEL